MKTLALIIDNEIVEIISFDDRLADILLSNPVLMDISKYQISKEWSFDGNSFRSVVDGEEVVISPNGV
jgi:hypothetical protein